MTNRLNKTRWIGKTTNSLNMSFKTKDSEPQGFKVDKDYEFGWVSLLFVGWEKNDQRLDKRKVRRSKTRPTV